MLCLTPRPNLSVKRDCRIGVLLNLLLFSTTAFAVDNPLPLHPYEGRYVSRHVSGCASVDSELSIKCKDEICRSASFTVGTYSCYPLDAPHQGWISGEMFVRSGIGLAQGAEDDPECNLVFVFRTGNSASPPKFVEVRHFGDCNVGQGAEPDKVFSRMNTNHVQKK